MRRARRSESRIRPSVGGGLSIGNSNGDAAPRLKAIEAENSRLKRIAADETLEIPELREVPRGSW